MPDAVTTSMVRTAADARAVREGCYFDPEAAERVRRFMRKLLRHGKGRRWKGKPFEPQPWQFDDVIAPLFGWKLPDGRRRFRTAYVEIPKKNGKSTLAAAIALYLLVADGEPGAAVFSVAVTREQAMNVHAEALKMVALSPYLKGRLGVHGSTGTITDPETMSEYKILTGDADSGEGRDAHGMIIDELHAWDDRNVFEALRYAGRAREQPLLFIITTAGDDPQGVCREQHDYAKGVLKGTIDDVRFYPYIRAARRKSEGDGCDDDIHDPETWARANPSLGATIDPADIKEDIRAAERSPSSMARFLQYTFNVWASARSPWLDANAWAACRRSYTLADLAGRTGYAALDLSKTRDMTALVFLFPGEDDPEECMLWPMFFLPEGVIDDRKSPEQYRVWRDLGLLEATPGDVCDYAYVRRRFRETAGGVALKEFAYDPWNAEQVTQEMEADTGVERVAFKQTLNNLADATAEFERLVLAGKMLHPGHPVLDWQASHVQVYTDASGNKRPVKPPHEDPRKIDGVQAAVMCVGRSRARFGDAGRSVYETRGVWAV